MLERLTLTNFKAIKDEVFDLENLTILSGLNCMGKSSFLHSILLLRQSYEQNLLPSRGLALIGEYVNIGNGEDLIYISTTAEKEVGIKLEWSNATLDFSFGHNESSDFQPISKNKIDGKPFETSIFNKSFKYLSAERITPKSNYKASDFVVNQQNSLGNTGEYTAHFLALYGNRNINIDALKHPECGDNNLLNNINAWMSNITPGIKVIAQLLSQTNEATLRYQFVSKNELTREFRPENTGFGITYLLPVVTAILSAKPYDLLLIENPESHLHPAGQTVIAKLMALAAENNVQIIVETHSDHFLNGVRTSIKQGKIDAENVATYFFDRDIDNNEHMVNIEKITILPDGSINHWPTNFFDEWDNALDILIS